MTKDEWSQLGGTMSEEEGNAAQEAISSYKEDQQHEKMSDKFSLITGETIIASANPSFFAFFSMHVLAVVVGIVHYTFDFISLADDPDSGLLTWLKDMVVTDAGKAIAFPLMMLLLAWFNRLLNIYSSVRWYRSSLLMFAVLPFLVVVNILI